ncbi:type II toxin-antitoxin system HicA family toxin [candidate division KSB1 bacterium]|nr:type II toxin-antitoxin system HicA family toxin [candidate division KSB1 bacterium]
MSKLPVVSGQDVVKTPAKIGYVFDHQRGSHIVLRQNFEPFRRVTVPNHKEIAKGTLRKIIREAGLTLEDFISLL